MAKSSEKNSLSSEKVEQSVSREMSISPSESTKRHDKTFEENYAISSEFQTSGDPIRSALERYWVDYASEVKYKKAPYSSYTTIVGGTLYNGTLLDGITYYTAQEVVFAPIFSDFEGSDDYGSNPLAPTRLSDALQSLQTTDDPIEVYAYNCNKPIQYPSHHDNTAKPNTPNIDISYVYNYGLPNYEQLISDQSIKEASLMNYYIDYEDIHEALTIATLSSFDPTAGPKDGPSISYSISPDTKNKIDSNLSTQTMKKPSIDQNIIIPPDAMEGVSGKTEDLLALPFYVKINIGKAFPPRYASELESLESTSKTLLTEIMKYSLDVTSPGANIDYFKKRNFNYSHFNAQYENENQTQTSLTKVISSDPVYLIDAVDLSQNINNESVIVNSNNPQATIITSTDSSTTSGCSTSPSFAAYSTLPLEVKYLLGPDGPLQNTYMDLIGGTPALYSTNILFYKISKFEDSDLETPIQNIFIPNDGKSQTYIDFQVKYGKRYVYKIYAYKFVSGTEYNLSKTIDPIYSAFLSEINEYKKKESAISVKVKYHVWQGLNQRIYTNTYGYQKALNSLVVDLNEMKISEGKETISQPQESMDSTDPPSEGLRAALKALQVYWGTDSTDNAGTFLSNTIAPIISGFLGTASESSSVLDDATRERLKDLRTDIANYTDIGEQLLADFENVLASKDGFGKDKPTRVTAAKTYIEKIQDFQVMEDDILEILSSIKDFEVDSESDIAQSKKTKITAVLWATVDLAEIPYYKNAGTILDAPPVSPDVNFIPYRADAKNISFFMNSGIGKVTDIPIIFSEQEATYYTSYRESKKLNAFEPIQFISDETKNLASSFEIYRLTSPPADYGDFQNALYKTISENFKGGLSTLSSASFKEKVRPNKTYYYMFRQRDGRGIVSNPSAVFSITLVSDGSAVFPLINQYSFQNKKNDYSRTVRKLMNISPSIDRVTPRGLPGADTFETYDPGTSVDNLLGLQDEGIFGKTFKIRFTSKKTGRQIDLNVTFEATVA